MMLKKNTKKNFVTEGKKAILGQILEYLKKSCNCKSNEKLAEKLNVKVQDINKWKSGQSSGKRSTEKLVKAIIRHSLKISYEPIMELTPIRLLEDDCFVIGKTKKEQEKLKKDLVDNQGIYLFYDSLGKALYAGKTSRQNLWKELGNAFFRDRPVQLLYKSSGRQIRKQQYYLYEVAHYVSAYAVHAEAIKDFEALIIRAFPNDLTNVRIEKKTLSFDNKEKLSQKRR